MCHGLPNPRPIRPGALHQAASGGAICRVPCVTQANGNQCPGVCKLHGVAPVDYSYVLQIAKQAHRSASAHAVHSRRKVSPVLQANKEPQTPMATAGWAGDKSELPAETLSRLVTTQLSCGNSGGRTLHVRHGTAGVCSAAERRGGGVATDSAGAAVGQGLAHRYAGDDTRAGEPQFRRPAQWSPGTRIRRGSKPHL